MLPVRYHNGYNLAPAWYKAWKWGWVPTEWKLSVFTAEGEDQWEFRNTGDSLFSSLTARESWLQQIRKCCYCSALNLPLPDAEFHFQKHPAWGCVPNKISYLHLSLLDCPARLIVRLFGKQHFLALTSLNIISLVLYIGASPRKAVGLDNLSFFFLPNSLVFLGAEFSRSHWPGTALGRFFCRKPAPDPDRSPW